MLITLTHGPWLLLILYTASLEKKMWYPENINSFSTNIKCKNSKGIYFDGHTVQFAKLVAAWTHDVTSCSPCATSLVSKCLNRRQSYVLFHQLKMVECVTDNDPSHLETWPKVQHC